MHVKIAAIVGVVIMVAISTWHGIDGVITAGGMAIVAGLGGYEIGVKKK